MLINNESEICKKNKFPLYKQKTTILKKVVEEEIKYNDNNKEYSNSSISYDSKSINNLT